MKAASENAFPAALALGQQRQREETAHLAAKARKGTHAIFATRLISILATAASITIVARLVPPSDFGVWAMAGVPLGVMTIVREFGLLSSIVQARNLTLQQRDAYFWASVAVSLASALLLALAAPVLARFYDTPLLAPVVWTSCVSLTLGGLGLVHAALLHRSLEYTRLAVMEGGGMLFGVSVGIVLAYLWRDVWALVGGHIAHTAWTSASAWLLCRWVPGAPRRRPARIDLSFSFQVTLYNVLTYAGNNIGLVAGYRLRAMELGFFSRGQQLYHLTHFAFLTPITQVGYALLCHLRPDPAAYRRAYIALARRVGVLFIPFGAVLPFLAHDLTLALLGPTWMPASAILAWFAPAVVGQAFTSLFGQLMASQKRGRELRICAMVDLLLRSSGAVIGSQFGVVGLAAGFSLATLLLSVPLMVWAASRSGVVKPRDQLVAIWPGVLLGIAATLATVLVLPGAVGLGLNPGWSRLLFVGGSAALAWALLCVVLRPARDALVGRGMAHE